MTSRAIAACVLAFGVCGAQAEVLRLEGDARDPDDGALLYRELHFIDYVSERPEQRVVLYRCAAGEGVFARKRVHYGNDIERPEFELDDARRGYREGLRRGAGDVPVAFVQKPREDQERSEAVATSDRLVADAGFDEFVKRHWDALQRDEDVPLDFVVPANLDSMALKIRRQREETIDGRTASVIRLSLGAWWGFVAPHIDAAYDEQTRQLLRYEGISNLRDSNGRNLEVRIDFPPAGRVPSDAGALQAALILPLVASCE